MSSEDVFYAFLSAVVSPGPNAASSVSVQLAVRRSYVKLLKAAVAYWHVVRGSRAVFACEWSPRMVVFCSGITRFCVHASMEKVPLLLSDVRALFSRGESSPARLHAAVRSADLPPTGSGLGSPHGGRHGTAPGGIPVGGLFGVRCASGEAALRVPDVCVNEALEDVKITVRRHRNDQFGVGQLAHMVALPSWEGASPVRLLSD